MEVLRELMKKPRQSESLAIGCFVAAVLYTIYRGTAHTVLVGLGITLIVLGLNPRYATLAFLAGASGILLVQTYKTVEGFSTDTKAGGSAEPTVVEDPAAAAVSAAEEVEDDATDKTKKKQEKEAVDELLHGTNNDRKAVEGFGKKKVMLPDNADRKEMLELGKPYKLPNENDDKGYHLDSGTTFLNAYKALKPDQIAAMTKDTQELLATQKSLVAMLDSFGPLMKDMGKITGFLGPSGPV